MLVEAVPLIVIKFLVCSLHLCFSPLLHLLPLVHFQQVLATNLVNSCIRTEAFIVAVVLCQAKRPGCKNMIYIIYMWLCEVLVWLVMMTFQLSSKE